MSTLRCVQPERTVSVPVINSKWVTVHNLIFTAPYIYLLVIKYGNLERKALPQSSLLFWYILYYLDDNELALALPSGVLEALQLQTCDANDVVALLQESLSLERTSLEQPDPETKRQIRCLCMEAKNADRLDVVKKLREIVPAGTTGEFFSYLCNT